MSKGWIGVDLDGTLAEYHGWKSNRDIGEPIPAMVDRVKEWSTQGKNIKIFTARVAEDDPEELETVIQVIRLWCIKHLGFTLPITNVKDYAMIECWDDRSIQVIKNTGKRADGEE